MGAQCFAARLAPHRLLWWVFRANVTFLFWRFFESRNVVIMFWLLGPLWITPILDQINPECVPCSIYNYSSNSYLFTALSNPVFAGKPLIPSWPYLIIFRHDGHVKHCFSRLSWLLELTILPMQPVQDGVTQKIIVVTFPTPKLALNLVKCHPNFEPVIFNQPLKVSRLTEFPWKCVTPNVPLQYVWPQGKWRGSL